MTWTALPTTINGTENFAFAYVPHFSTFTLAGTPTVSIFAPNNNSVKVYPNPYKKNDAKFGGDYIYFGNVSYGAVIKIYNIAGELIKEIDVDEAIEKWDVRGIASGVYIYTVTGGSRGKSVGKIGITKW
ncbi:MAG: T9SS type A sorting domain-containing protein [bacterium]|nr:T9SS type A sorting domain-containing protein [bacterium]